MCFFKKTHKKILTFFLASVMVFGLFGVTAAAQDETAAASGDWITDASAGQTADELEHIDLSEQAAQEQSAADGTDGISTMSSGSYKDWTQFTGAWSTLTLGTSSDTVARSGCLVVALAKMMVQSGIRSESSFTPSDMLSWLNSNGLLNSSGCLTSYEGVADFSPRLNYVGLQDYSASASGCKDTILDLVRSGYQVILRVSSSRYPIHFVLVDNALSLANDDVYIMDSAYSNYASGYTLTTNYSSVTRYICYSVSGSEDPVDYFEDVSSGSWYYDAVKYVSGLGIMTGMTPYYFGAAEPVSRGQFVTILYRMAGSPEVSYDDTFLDIGSDQFYTSAVIWASKNGIVSGYDNGCFGPADQITREQMAAMMYRYASYKGYDMTAGSGISEMSAFEDSGSVSNFAADAIAWACSTGLIRGVAYGIIDPQGSAVRAQCATIIMRFLNL